MMSADQKAIGIVSGVISFISVVMSLFIWDIRDRIRRVEDILLKGDHHGR